MCAKNAKKKFIISSCLGQSVSGLVGFCLLNIDWQVPRSPCFLDGSYVSEVKAWK